MSVDVTGLVLNGVYNTTSGYLDHAGERKRKVIRLANAGNVNNVARQFAAIESLTLASLFQASVSQQLAVDVVPTAPSTSGIYSLANIRLVLGFERAHPLNAAKTITAGYAIPAPVNAIVSTSNPKRPVAVRGVAWDDVSGPTEMLGWLIDYLEDALTFESVDGTISVGEWTYVESRSGVGTTAGVIDADVRT